MAASNSTALVSWQLVRGQQPLHICSGMVVFVNDICLHLDSLTPQSPSTKLARCANNHFEFRILAPRCLFPRVRVRKCFTDALSSNVIEKCVR